MSGTAVLELALAEEPTVALYRANAFTAWLARRLAVVPYVSLPNLLDHFGGERGEPWSQQGRPGGGSPANLPPPRIPELLFEACTPEAVALTLERLLLAHQPGADGQPTAAAREATHAAARLRACLRAPPGDAGGQERLPSERAAQVVVAEALRNQGHYVASRA